MSAVRKVFSFPAGLRRGLRLALLLGPLLASGAEVPGVSAERLFGPRSGPRGATLFSAVSPATSGIVATNDYADPEMWNRRYVEFTVGGLGTGITIGDYDRDGLPDVFVVSKTEESRLFRNRGDWKFEDVTAQTGVGRGGALTDRLKDWVGWGGSSPKAVGMWEQGATFVDVDNDGWLDLYVCRFGVPNLLYMNQRDGTFREEAAARGLAVVDASGMAAFCDYDRDGWLDVYLLTNLLQANEHPEGQRDYLFRNHGDGTFQNVTERAGIAGVAQTHSATWWDYNNDGWPDLYVANDFAPPDKLYRNNGDGTFTDVLDRVVPHTPHSSMGADLGDVNNDGLIDFFVTDMAATSYEKDQRGMAGERERKRNVEDQTNPDVAPQNLRNALFLNTGTDFVQETAALNGIAATDWSWAALLEDLDLDGRLDLYVTNGMIREETNADIMDRMMIAESPVARARVLRSSPVLAEPNLVYQNRGDHEFREIGAEWGLNQSGVSFGAAFGDLDGDGDLDLVFSNFEAGPTVLRNDIDTGHRVIIALRGTRSNRYGVGATVRLESAAGVQVRQLVLSRGYLSSSEPVLHFGLGADARIHRLIVTWPSGIVQQLEDMDADRHLTITEPDIPAPTLNPARREGERPVRGQFTDVSGSTTLAFVSREDVVDENAQQRLLSMRHNRRGPALAVGDLGGDPEDDVLLGGTTRDPARMVLSMGSGRYAPATALGSGAASTLNEGPVLVFDANGDGRNEILITKGGAKLPEGVVDYLPQLLVPDGGKFSAAPKGVLPDLPLNVGAAGAADWDRDGRLDVFLGGRVRPGDFPATPRSALLQNRGGRFEDVTDAVAPALRRVGMVTGALWTDVDDDGWLDLLLTLDWGRVTFFRNVDGKRFEDRTEAAGFAAAGTGWWNAITAADFNGDGRLDYVVGNAGLNTQYRAEPGRPALLFSGDFNGSGNAELIEARYDGDRLVPWRSRKQLGAVIRPILRRYPKNDDFARATLAEIFGDAALAGAQRLVATELRNGVFFRQPDGTFRFTPLPRTAQIAPIFGVVAGDFDGDGHADIYAVQNSFAPIPVVGRFDGGLSQLLRGDGRGGFLPAPPADSGLIVRGDAKGLVVLDLDRDGWPDFLVSRNNHSTLAFRNNGVADRHSFQVRLRGSAGNPTAVGARVTLELADGSRQTSEVYAGSGYYSQSAAALFFGHPAGNPPRRLHVRWPSGATTTEPVPPGSGPIVLTAPPG